MFWRVVLTALLRLVLLALRPELAELTVPVEPVRLVLAFTLPPRPDVPVPRVTGVRCTVLPAAAVERVLMLLPRVARLVL